MGSRKGVFIGAYVPPDLKKALQQRANSVCRTLSQEVRRVLEESLKGEWPAVERRKGVDRRKAEREA